MWLFVLVILVPLRTTDECKLQVLPSRTTSISVASGGLLNLSCEFLCISREHRGQLQRNHTVLVESGVSGASSTHNLSLTLLVPAARQGDAGQYRCQTNPPDVIAASVRVSVMEVTTSKMKPVCEPPPQSSSSPLWALANAPMWYLMGKAAVFMAWLLSAVLKRSL